MPRFKDGKWINLDSQSIDYIGFRFNDPEGGLREVRVFNKCISLIEVNYLKSFFNCFELYSKPLVVFDCGTNVGGYTDLLQQVLLRKDSQVHCFEANYIQMSFPLIGRFSSDDRVKLNFKAVGRELGMTSLKVPAVNNGAEGLVEKALDFMSCPKSMSGTSSTSVDHIEENHIDISVPLVTIDTYCAENSISSIDWLKMDIEGSELDAFIGAQSMLFQKRIVAGSFEIISLEKAIKIQDILHKYGYKILASPKLDYSDTRWSYVKEGKLSETTMLPPEAICVEEVFKDENKISDLMFIRDDLYEDFSVYCKRYRETIYEEGDKNE